jgi:hypothetical protein
LTFTWIVDLLELVMRPPRIIVAGFLRPRRTSSTPEANGRSVVDVTRAVTKSNDHAENPNTYRDEVRSSCRKYLEPRGTDRTSCKSIKLNNQGTMPDQHVDKAVNSKRQELTQLGHSQTTFTMSWPRFGYLKLSLRLGISLGRITLFCNWIGGIGRGFAFRGRFVNIAVADR